MFELFTNQLWIANAMEARDAKQLFEVEIGAVVDVAYEESPAHLPRQLIYCRYPLNDGAGNSAATIRLAVRTVIELVRNRVPTTIACSAGMSRSPTVAAFALAGLQGVSPETALHKIAEKQPLQLNAALWNEVVAALSDAEFDSNPCFGTN